MIQAGTITIGSGRTWSVAAAYWMISASAVHDLAGGDGDRFPDLERLGAGRRLPGAGTPQILGEI
jgi:hypothetical protein